VQVLVGRRLKLTVSCVARLEGPPTEDSTGEGRDGGTGGVSSIAYRQLEKQNLRLKDALLRFDFLSLGPMAKGRH